MQIFSFCAIWNFSTSASRVNGNSLQNNLDSWGSRAPIPAPAHNFFMEFWSDADRDSRGCDWEVTEICSLKGVINFCLPLPLPPPSTDPAINNKHSMSSTQAFPSFEYIIIKFAFCLLLKNSNVYRFSRKGKSRKRNCSINKVWKGFRHSISYFQLLGKY